MHTTSAETNATTRILQWLEEFAPLGLIITAAAALAQEGYFQYKFWFDAFPGLPGFERHYVGLSVAAVMGGLRLWFLIMSSRDVAAGNKWGYIIGIGASVSTLAYTVWECFEIATRYAGDQGRASIVMFIFTSVVVVAAEIRIMLSRFGSWRSSAAQMEEFIENMRTEVAEAEARKAEAEAEVRKLSEAVAELRKQSAEAVDAEARKRKELETELYSFRTEAEVRAARRNRKPEAGSAKTEAGTESRAGTGTAGTGSDWPEVLASAYRNFLSEKGRVPTGTELAGAAGTSDKTERKYRNDYLTIINQ